MKSMNTREFQRLCKIDEEIISLRISYERQRQHELLTGKRTLLLSKGIKAQIDRAMKARKYLAAEIATKPTQKAIFAAKLHEKKVRLDDAIAELPSLLHEKAMAAAQLVADNNPDTKLAFKEAEFEVMRQQSRIGALERAYVAFAKKDEYIPERQTRNKLPADYSAKLDLNMEWATKPIEEESESLPLAPTRIEDTALGRSENWNISVGKPKNNASLDMLAGLNNSRLSVEEPQRKRVVIDFDE